MSLAIDGRVATLLANAMRQGRCYGVDVSASETEYENDYLIFIVDYPLVGVNKNYFPIKLNIAHQIIDISKSRIIYLIN